MSIVEFTIMAVTLLLIVFGAWICQHKDPKAVLAGCLVGSAAMSLLIQILLFFHTLGPFR